MLSAREKAKRLLEEQVLSVLCTRGKVGPYASLMAYVYNKDEDAVYMVTKAHSEKHRNMLEHPRVALLVDDRSETTHSTSGVVSALTVEGTVVSCEQEPGIPTMLVTRFPDIAPLLDDPDSIVLCIELDRFLLLEGPKKAIRGTFRDLKQE